MLLSPVLVCDGVGYDIWTKCGQSTLKSWQPCLMDCLMSVGLLRVHGWYTNFLSFQMLAVRLVPSCCMTLNCTDKDKMNFPVEVDSSTYIESTLQQLKHH